MAQPVAFITGIAGFAGSWLAEELLHHGYRVAGSVYDNESLDNLAACRSELTLVGMDVAAADQVAHAVAEIGPDYIFHLAAVASVARSFAGERQTYRINFEGTLNLLEAARSVQNLRKFVFVGSCDAYGIIMPEHHILTEDDPFNPISPYGISKAAAEFLCRRYVRQGGLPVTVARAFNHSGPRQSPDFVIADFARQIAAIDLGLQPPEIRVGNLAPQRDFSDVRDIVRGYRLIAENGAPGRAYQLCSGEPRSIADLLMLLAALTDRDVKITVDQSKVRPADIPVLQGSNRRAVEELGFTIRYKIEQTVRDTFQYWKERLSVQNRIG